MVGREINKDIEKASGSTKWFIKKICCSTNAKVYIQPMRELGETLWNKVLSVVFNVGAGVGLGIVLD